MVATLHMSKNIVYDRGQFAGLVIWDGGLLTEPRGDGGECLGLARLHSVDARRFYHINKTNINHT